MFSNVAFNEIHRIVNEFVTKQQFFKKAVKISNDDIQNCRFHCGWCSAIYSGIIFTLDDLFRIAQTCTICGTVANEITSDLIIEDNITKETYVYRLYQTENKIVLLNHLLMFVKSFVNLFQIKRSNEYHDE